MYALKILYMKQAISRSYKYIDCQNIYCAHSNVVFSKQQAIHRVYILNSNVSVGMQCSFSVLAAVMQYNCLCFCR